MICVPSSDGVAVAVHRFGGPDEAPRLLISHATGFHAHCYAPVAARLNRDFQVYGLDHRGHGATPAPPGWTVDWSRFGDDTLAVAREIAPDGGLVGVGHSMGGSALVMAASRDPGLFRRLVLFEPIAFPAAAPRIGASEEHPIVSGARRRRRVFASAEDAIANFARKPPLSVMTPEVLRCYVEHGFHPVADGVELSCSPDIEAGIFMAARDNGVWDLLRHVEVRTTVVTGRIDEMQPSGRAEDIARELPNGGILHLPHQSHLGPFSHPDEFAELVGDLVEEVG